jgi:hypothetical protein
MTADVRPIKRRNASKESVIETRFDVRDGELWRVRVVDDEPKSSQRVCNFVPEVVERIETLDAVGQLTVSYLLNLHTVRGVERVEVADAKLLTFLTDVPGLVSDEGRDRPYLRRAIAESAIGKPTTRRYAHTGWATNDAGRNVFLHAAGAIAANGPAEGMRAHVTGSLMRYQLPDPPDVSATTVRQAIDTFLAAGDPEVMVPLLAAVARAPLGGPPNYWIHLVGATGAGKTSLAQLTVSFYGPDLAAEDSPTHAWTSSANALELNLANACDVPVVVDEFTGAGPQQEAGERIGRSTTGATRDRARPDFTVRAGQRPGGLLISTGEADFDRASLQARALAVVCARPKPVTTPAFRAAQHAGRTGLFATVGAAYVQDIAAHRDRHGADPNNWPYWWTKHTPSIRAQVDEVVDRTEVKPHPRQPMIVTDLLSALAWFYGWTVRVGACSETAARQRTREAFRILCTTIHGAAFDEAAQAIDMLRDALTAGRCHLTNRSGGLPTEHSHLLGWTPGSGMYDTRPCGPRVGYIHDNLIDLMPGTLIEVLRDAQRRAGTDPNLTRRRIVRLWHEHGWLDHDRHRGTYGGRRRIGNAQVPIWPIPYTLLFPDTGIDDLDAATQAVAQPREHDADSNRDRD